MKIPAIAAAGGLFVFLIVQSTTDSLRIYELRRRVTTLERRIDAVEQQGLTNTLNMQKTIKNVQGSIGTTIVIDEQNLQMWQKHLEDHVEHDKQLFNIWRHSHQ